MKKSLQFIFGLLFMSLGTYAGGGWADCAVSATLTSSFTFVDAPTISGILPTSGLTAGGTSVVITGTNLTDASAVKFGSTNATSFKVNSATQITAVSPAGSAGVVDVTVATVGGTSASSSANQFTFVGNALAQNQYMYIMKDGAVIKKQSIQLYLLGQCVLFFKGEVDVLPFSKLKRKYQRKFSVNIRQ